jgi:nucleoside-diphosphate-sugar epimerase
LSPGQQLLDLVYIEDVVRAFRLAAEFLNANGSVKESYAVSSGSRRSLRQTVEIYEKVSGASVPVVWGGRDYRAREVMVPWQGHALPGWSAKFSLEQGLRQVLERGVV